MQRFKVSWLPEKLAHTLHGPLTPVIWLVLVSQIKYDLYPG